MRRDSLFLFGMGGYLVTWVSNIYLYITRQPAINQKYVSGQPLGII